MAKALEMDGMGRLTLTDGIPFGPPLAAVQPGQLKKGDVLVWYTLKGDWKTKAIQEFSHGPFSHVGIYVGGGKSVDAGPAGVDIESIGNLTANFAYGWVFRKPGLTLQQQSKIVEAALSNRKRGYAWMDAIALPLRRRAFYANMNPRHRGKWMAILGRFLIARRKRRPPSEKKTFCSRMVIEAFAAIRYFPREYIDACTHTPFDLAADNFFVPVGWLCDPQKSPDWHPFDPYSPQRATQRKWSFSLMRIWFAK